MAVDQVSDFEENQPILEDNFDHDQADLYD